jgi:hypothetical protein
MLLVFIGISGFNDAKSQDTSYVFGNKIQKQKVNYYDFSDPTKVNFEVIAWGGFKNPGKYLVPEGTTMIDMMTYAGLPPNSDLLSDVKLVRAKDITSKYQSSSVIKFNFKKFFDKETTVFTTENPLVKPGDIILVPLELDKGFWDYFKEGLIIIGPIASILSLIVTINSNK